MPDKQMQTVDGNEAVASVAHRLNEVAVIYPITPSSTMGELADDWSMHGHKNIWGNIPDVIEMQSEGGAAGAVHGSLQNGALTTTFTASQGLLLMIPNMYKVAGELTAYCMHVSARTLATHALSIFGDHSDVMACRQTGFAMLSSNSVQEAHDMACIAQAATLQSRVPFMHFFDGFRTSHEVSKYEHLSDDDLRAMVDEDWISQHRKRALSPDRPVIRGTAQNPDAFFQAREACNPFYEACPGIVSEVMDRFAKVTGRQYGLVDYVGHPEAEHVVVMMGSGAEAAHETVDYLVDKGERVGLLKVRLFRPFPMADLVTALPETVRSIGVLDRTKEPGAAGEPLYLEVVTSLNESMQSPAPRFAQMPIVTGGRYGLSSKEFTPAMVKAVYDNIAGNDPKRRFTVGINDDVTGLSLPYDADFTVEPDDVVRAVFYGLGADGTVGANKNSIKIIAENTDSYAQAYFVYDSKKSGAITVSHLRFSPRLIQSTYQIETASFVACHQFNFLERYDVLEKAADGATFLLNAHHPADEVWDHLPNEIQQAIIEKNIKVYVIDASKVAKDAGMGRRINTIMQTCFFAISGVLERDEAIGQIKKAIEKTYGRKSQELVDSNFAAVDAALAHLHEMKVPKDASSKLYRLPPVPDHAPDFVKQVTGMMLAGKGDLLPVSAFPVDGTWPVGTTQYEKRNITEEIPVWDEKLCIQCNKCMMVCPHAAIRLKITEPANLKKAPKTFKSVPFHGKEFPDQSYLLQVAPEDCTGCTLCVEVCPAKDKANPQRKSLEMQPQRPIRDQERENYDFFLNLPETDRTTVPMVAKFSQVLQPLFEYSGACSGCGETPYIKLVTQLFGDRTIIANATGCSSIYGGSLPTTPYTTNPEGRGPAWANSLFEDNAEFGLGMRLAVDHQEAHAKELVKGLSGDIGDDLVTAIINAEQNDETGIRDQRERVAALHQKLAGNNSPEAKRLDDLADYLVRKSIWIVGGDGWAYDIGYGGLDHVLSTDRDVNILVMDTEVYSNTGGQQSKATPLGAAAKFAMAGRPIPKKNLGMEAMAYGHVYVASVAMGAKDAQVVRAFTEAESYRGPSLIIAYSHCIAHGYDLSHGLTQQKLAVDSGHWSLYRSDPRLMAEGKPPLQMDSGAPKTPLGEFMRHEARFRIVERQDPERYKMLLKAAEKNAKLRHDLYKYMAGFSEPIEDDDQEAAE